MNIDLKTFSLDVEPAILQRGKNYYKAGAVEELSITESEIRAQVRGSAVLPYTVTLQAQEGTIIDAHCDCPYDWGDVCKHIIAVLYTVAKGQAVAGSHELQESEQEQPSTKAASEKQFAQLLKRARKQQLIDFIMSESALCASCRDAFVLRMQGQGSKSQETVAYYTAKMQKELSSYGDYHDYMDGSYYDQRSQVMDKMLELAEQKMNKKELKAAFCALGALIQYGSELSTEDGDDDCELAEAIAQAIEHLEALSTQPMSVELARFCFHYTLDCYQQRLYKDYDWHLDMIRLAGAFANTANELEVFRAVLLAACDSSSSRWERDELQLLMADLIAKQEGEGAMYDYMRAHLDIEEFRHRLVRHALEHDELSEASDLVENAIVIRTDGDDHAFALFPWLKYRLEIELRRGDTAKLLLTAKQLYLYYRGDDRRYYDLLKQYSSPSQWSTLLPELYSAFLTRGDKYPKLACWEQDWERYLAWLAAHADYSTLKTAQSALPASCYERVLDLYERVILQEMERNMGRSHYQSVARALRSMKKMQAAERVSQLAASLRTLYPRRKALHDELKSF